MAATRAAAAAFAADSDDDIADEKIAWWELLPSRFCCERDMEG
jgi:hypothetical protein